MHDTCSTSKKKSVDRGEERWKTKGIGRREGRKRRNESHELGEEKGRGERVCLEAEAIAWFAYVYRGTENGNWYR